MKIAKVIATSFYYRTIRYSTELCGNPPVYTLHSQKFTNDEEIKKLILFNIENENNCNPGIPVDLILVNNDVGNKDGNDFVSKFNGKEIKNGKIIVIQNNNNGWSYGAYNRAFQDLKDNYDYFIFTEDDVILAKENYAKILYDIFINNQNCGFVSYLGLSYNNDSLSLNDSIHAHGAYGFTSTAILKEVNKKYGRLPHSDFYDKKYYENIILEGEIKFTNCILKMGYSLLEVPDNNKLFEPAYDLMRGIKKPWRPSKFSSYIWIFKKKLRKAIYEFLIYFKLYVLYKKIRKLFLKY